MDNPQTAIEWAALHRAEQDERDEQAGPSRHDALVAEFGTRVSGPVR